ncbi:hypothetical protein LTR37_021160, partial [Vermiconidia calcicola]
MPSRLEDSLLRCEKINGKVRETLFACLDDGIFLRRMRVVSRPLRDLVDKHPGRAFRQLYIRAPDLGTNTTDLETVAPLCYTLTIKVGFPEMGHDLNIRPSGEQRRKSKPSDEQPRRSREFMQSLLERRSLLPSGKKRKSLPPLQQSFESLSLTANARASIPPAQLPNTDRRQQVKTRQRWTTLLSRFHQLGTLTLRVNGDRAWPGRTEVEDMLVTLRVAIENAGLQNLRTVCLAPVHAMGIIHLRWLGIGTFSEALASGARIWMGIETLDLRIHSSFGGGRLTDVQQTMFKKILYDYLRSFAPSLRCLRLVWLGGEGPSPMALHQDPALEDRPPIKWPKLEELWVGNIIYPNQTITLTRQLARPDTCLRVLRSTRRDSSMEADDPSAWVEVLGVPSR